MLKVCKDNGLWFMVCSLWFGVCCHCNGYGFNNHLLVLAFPILCTPVRQAETWRRFVGNTFIAIGALLPGIGGAFTRFGHTEVLYVTEFVGLVMIFIGYRYATSRLVAEAPSKLIAA